MSLAVPSSAAPYLSTHFRPFARHSPSYTDSSAKVCLSSDQRFLACWCSGDVAILSLDDGRVLQKIESTEDDEFLTFAITKDNEKIVTASRRTNTIAVWRISDGEEISSFRLQTQPILDLEVDQTASLVACASADRTVKVYDLKKGHATHNFKGHTGRVCRVWFHPDPKRLLTISASEGGEILVADLNTNQTHILSNHISQVTAISFSPDYSTMLSAGRDKIVSVWNMATFQMLKILPVFEPLEGIFYWPPTVKLPENLTKQPTAGALVFATGGEKGEIRLWDSKSYQCLFTHSLPAFSPNSQKGSEKYIANQIMRLITRFRPIESNTPDNSPSLTERFQMISISAEQNFHLFSSDFSSSGLYLGHNDEIYDIKCLPSEDGEKRVVLATNSPQIRILHYQRDFQADILSGHSDIVLAIDISSCGRYLVSGGKDCTLRWWDLEFSKDSHGKFVPQCVAICEGHAESLGALAINQNSKKHGALFAISGARDRTMKIWDATEMFKQLSSAGSKNPKKLSEEKKLYEIPAISTRLAHEKDINCISIAPNDRFAASGSEDKTIKIWSLLGNGNSLQLALVATLKGHKRGVWAVKFSPVEKILASASGDATIKLWNLQMPAAPVSGVDGAAAATVSTSFTCLRTFSGHTGSIKSLQFLNQGQQLLSCADDSYIKLWNIKSNSCVSSIRVMENEFSSSEASEDGRSANEENQGKNGKIKKKGGEDEEDEEDLDSSGAKFWCISLSPDEKFCFTGGSGGILSIYQDFTQEILSNHRETHRNQQLQEQELNNAIKSRQFSRAIHLSLKLNMPRKCLGIFNELFLGSFSSTALAINLIEGEEEENHKGENKENPSSSSSAASSNISLMVQRILLSLNDKEMDILFDFLFDWNTNARSASIAHYLWNILSRTMKMDYFIRKPSISSKLQGFLLYSDRHYQRLDRLLQKSHLFDVLLATSGGIAEKFAISSRESMKLLEDRVNTESGKGRKEEKESGQSTVDSLSALSKAAPPAAGQSRILALDKLSQFEEGDEEGSGEDWAADGEMPGWGGEEWAGPEEAEETEKLEQKKEKKDKKKEGKPAKESKKESAPEPIKENSKKRKNVVEEETAEVFQFSDEDEAPAPKAAASAKAVGQAKRPKSAAPQSFSEGVKNAKAKKAAVQRDENPPAKQGKPGKFSKTRQ